MLLGRHVTCDIFDLPEKVSGYHQVKPTSLLFHICHQYESKKVGLCAFAFIKSFAFPQTIRAGNTRFRPVKTPELYARPSRRQQEMDVAIRTWLSSIHLLCMREEFIAASTDHGMVEFPPKIGDSPRVRPFKAALGPQSKFTGGQRCQGFNDSP